MPEKHPTQTVLVQTAMRLFAEKGYNSTSVADILKEANVHSGSLYHHFETKQALLIAVLEHYRDGIEAMLIAPAWAGVTKPLERVFALLARYRELLVATECRYGCPIGDLALEIHEPDPAVQRLFAANFDQWTHFVKRCFDDATLILPPRISSQSLATLVLTTMEGGVMLSRSHRSVKPFDDAVSALRDYVSWLQPPVSRVRRKPSTKRKRI